MLDQQSQSHDGLAVVGLRGALGEVRQASQVDHVRWPFLIVYATGAVKLRSAERTIVLEPNECCVLRTSARSSLAIVDPADLVIAFIPASAVGPYHHVLEDADSRPYPTSHGSALLAGDVLRGLSKQLDSYKCPSPARLAHLVVGLLALMCSENATPEVGWTKRQLLAQAKQYIEDNLGDINLRPESIAAAQHVSARTLHRLFESEGTTISGWIRQRRLEQCRLDLADVALADHSIGEIGCRWGIWDAAHFSRLFKSAYGIPPRAYRMAVRMGEATTGLQAATVSTQVA